MNVSSVIPSRFSYICIAAVLHPHHTVSVITVHCRSFSIPHIKTVRNVMRFILNVLIYQYSYSFRENI
jgi:hypothetical protein